MKSQCNPPSSPAGMGCWPADHLTLPMSSHHVRFASTSWMAPDRSTSSIDASSSRSDRDSRETSSLAAKAAGAFEATPSSRTSRAESYGAACTSPSMNSR